jgi:hypothetical protein
MGLETAMTLSSAGAAGSNDIGIVQQPRRYAPLQDEVDGRSDRRRRRETLCPVAGPGYCGTSLPPRPAAAAKRAAVAKQGRPLSSVTPNNRSQKFDPKEEN